MRANETIEANRHPAARPEKARKSGRLHVCPLSAVPRLWSRQQRLAPRHLPARRRRGRDAHADQARLPRAPGMHDIAEPCQSYVAPNERARRAGSSTSRSPGAGTGPMVIHCWAGISRSTAAAFISLCALNPDAPEEADRAGACARPRPPPTPTDSWFGSPTRRSAATGRMVDAVEVIGRGVVASEAEPFSLAADHSPSKL